MPKSIYFKVISRMYLRRNVLESCKAKKCIKVPAQSHVIERGSLSRGKVWMMMTVLRQEREDGVAETETDVVVTV